LIAAMAPMKQLKKATPMKSVATAKPATKRGTPLAATKKPAAATKASLAAMKAATTAVAAMKRSKALVAMKVAKEAAPAKKGARAVAGGRKNPKQEELWEVDEEELSPDMAPLVEPNFGLDANGVEIQETEEDSGGEDADDEGEEEEEEAAEEEAADGEGEKTTSPMKSKAGQSKSQGGTKVIDGGKAKKAKKAARDPNKPARPCGGGYGVFVEENRADLKASVPEGSAITALSKAAGERWRAMDEEARKPYVEKYLQKKEIYDTKLEEYCTSIGATPPRKAAKIPEGGEGATPMKAEKGPLNISEESIDKIALTEVCGLGYETKFRTLIAERKFQGMKHDKIVRALRCCGGCMKKAIKLLQKSI